MRKRRAYLVVELDPDEIACILPPHLQGIVSRPLVAPVETREAGTSPGPWFPTEPEKRAKRTREWLERGRAQQAEAIDRGELDPPEE